MSEETEKILEGERPEAEIAEERPKEMHPEKPEKTKHPALLAIYLVLGAAALILGLVLIIKYSGTVKELTVRAEEFTAAGKELPEELKKDLANATGARAVGIALLPLTAMFLLAGLLLYNSKGVFWIRTILSMTIGSFLFFLLGRFLVIPFEIGETTFCFSPQYAFLAFMGGVFGPLTGFVTGIVGYFFVDLSRGAGVAWSWAIASGFFGLAMGFFARIMKLNKGKISGKKILLFNAAQLLVNLLTWLVIAPVLDMTFYGISADVAFVQNGLPNTFMNFLATGIFGTLLFTLWSLFQKEKEEEVTGEAAPVPQKTE